MNTQAVLFDLDDTLLRDDLTISDYTVSVLRRASERGVRVIPASGRAKESMKPFVERIGCAACYISCNGAEIWGPDHTLLLRHLLEGDTALEIARFGKTRGAYAQTYEGAYFFYSQEGHYARSYARSSMLKGQYVGDLEAYLMQHETSKILMMDEEAKIAQMLKEARAQFAQRVSVTCSKPYFLEFNPLEATKGKALLSASRMLGFDSARTAAFGDSLNDLSMLQAAGLGVAMRNARADVLSLIPTVCGDNQHDGVAHYIEDHILSQEDQP